MEDKIYINELQVHFLDGLSSVYKLPLMDIKDFYKGVINSTNIPFNTFTECNGIVNETVAFIEKNIIRLYNLSLNPMYCTPEELQLVHNQLFKTGINNTLPVEVMGEINSDNIEGVDLSKDNINE